MPFPSSSSYSTPQNYSDYTLYDLTPELQYNRLQNEPSYPRSEPSASVMALRGCHWWCTAVKPAPWPHITSTLTSSEMHHSSPKNSDPKAPLVATGGPSVPLHTLHDHGIVCPCSLCTLPNNVPLALYDATTPLPVGTQGESALLCPAWVLSQWDGEGSSTGVCRYFSSCLAGKSQRPAAVN